MHAQRVLGWHSPTHMHYAVLTPGFAWMAFTHPRALRGPYSRCTTRCLPGRMGQCFTTVQTVPVQAHEQVGGWAGLPVN